MAKSISIPRKLIAALAAAALFASASTAQQAQVETHDESVTIKINGEHFARYIYKGLAKPVVYDIHGPNGIRMTRQWPLNETPGEANDHPHQKSLWFTHGDVNGVDFWTEGEGMGTIHNAGFIQATGGDKATIRTRNNWVGPDGSIFCTDFTTIQAFADGDDRILDYAVTLTAPDDHDVRLGDTKEGTMGIRTHPALRLEPDRQRGVENVTGHAVNSNGTEGKPIWGQHAAWVDYYGEIDGETVGIAIFDHPDNPRHPTTWHAREYGLIAANPFGYSFFENAPAGTGEMLIPAGHAVTFRYRFIFHAGNTKAARIVERYQAYTEQDHR